MVNFGTSHSWHFSPLYKSCSSKYKCKRHFFFFLPNTSVFLSVFCRRFTLRSRWVLDLSKTWVLGLISVPQNGCLSTTRFCLWPTTFQELRRRKILNEGIMTIKHLAMTDSSWVNNDLNHCFNLEENQWTWAENGN